MDTFLITGASSDIGIATTKKLIDAGHRCLCLVKSEEGYERLKDSAVRHLEILDLSNSNDIESCITALLSQYSIDSFISLAAINEKSSFDNFTVAEAEKHIQVNALAPFFITRLLISGMKSRRFGRITLGSSIGVKFGGSSSSFLYSLSKHCGEFIPKEMRNLYSCNIFTNVVRIGVTNTSKLRSLGKDLSERKQMIPIGRLAEPGEIADFIAWISSRENTYITGQSMAISGGE